MLSLLEEEELWTRDGMEFGQNLCHSWNANRRERERETATGECQRRRKDLQQKELEFPRLFLLATDLHAIYVVYKKMHEEFDIWLIN